MFYKESLRMDTARVNEAMTRVYQNMFLAVVTSMLVSYFVGNSPELLQFFFTGITKWIVIFAPLVAVFFISFKMPTASKQTAQLMLHGFAALMGLSFATIFAVYTALSIVQAFLGAACLFLAMTLYGYTTKKDLTSVGSFMFVGLIGIIIASIINIFIGSTLMQMVISALAVIIFLGLTAYDTQKIREMVMFDNRGNAEVTGALTLYLDFINLFLSLLQLFGNRK
jgi:FtsH-binding integral membrane protein